MPDRHQPSLDLAKRRAIDELAEHAFSTAPAGEMALTSDSESMTPLLRRGDIVHWRRPSGPPRRGDLLVFRQHAKEIVHRVMARRKGGVVRTKGDARPDFDQELVHSREIQGVVVLLERGGEVRRLTGAKPRLYAWLAWGCAAFGAAGHRCATWGDEVLHRASPRAWGDRRFFRAPAWWLQRRSLGLIHVFLFEICHPPREKP